MLQRLVVLAVLAASVALVCATPPQETPIPTPREKLDTVFGRSKILLPEPTDAGEWNGTWYYRNRDARFALWFRTAADGSPEMKLQYLGLMLSPEGFVTDWKTRATYNVKDRVATFALDVRERGANRIEGTWDWKLALFDSGRFETAEITIYRAGDGRQLVMFFHNFNKTIKRGSAISSIDTDQAWTFRKASKRLVLFDELPF